MNYSSSSTHYKGLIPFMYSGENQVHHQHQEKEWLPCSTSSTTQIDVKLDPSTNENDDDNNNDNKDTQEGEGNNNSTDDGSSIEREHMFDKVVTPSDVGKLNRLVIPKQHAEKYFPLDSSTNTSTEQKAGLLLNFEDLSGKSWRFRYSYWNSSQSYVMTKGWSRFVKEKQLTAGDIVSFQRGVVGFEHKFFIDWRHRPPDRHHHPHHHHHHHHHLGTAFAVHRTIPGTATAWNNSSSTSTITPTTFFLRSHPYPTQTMPTSIWDHSRTTSTQLSQVNMMSTVPYASYSSYGSNININTSTNTTSTSTNSVVNSHLSRGSLIFVRSSPLTVPLPIDPRSPPNHQLNSSLYCNGRQQSLPEDDDDERKVFESVPVPVPLLHGKAAAKRSVRLFGVNVDCPPISHEDQN